MSNRKFRFEEKAPEPKTEVQSVILHRSHHSANWVVACGGTEVPFTTRTGRRLLYCWDTTTGDHAYLDLNTDLILSDDEARAALAVY